MKEAPEFNKDQDEVEEMVISQIRSRRDAGRKKYGTSMEREDLSLQQWLQHALEESLDFSIYIQKVIKILKNLRDDQTFTCEAVKMIDCRKHDTSVRMNPTEF